MIGYDPNGLMIYMAHKQKVYDALLGCVTDTKRKALEKKLTEQTKTAILKETGIEVGRVAIVCLPNGISLTGGIQLLHDHDDPDQHVTVKVTKIDYWGNISYNNAEDDDEEQSTHIGMITPCEG